MDKLIDWLADVAIKYRWFWGFLTFWYHIFYYGSFVLGLVSAVLAISAYIHYDAFGVAWNQWLVFGLALISLHCGIRTYNKLLKSKSE